MYFPTHVQYYMLNQGHALVSNRKGKIIMSVIIIAGNNKGITKKLHRSLEEENHVW